MQHLRRDKDGALRSRPIIGIATTALLASGVTLAVGGVAQADTIEPTNATPTISVDTASLAMSPSMFSSSPYSVDVTVGDADSLADLNTVTLCVYNQAQGDANCADGNLDARDTALITWSRADDSFTMDATTGGGADTSYWELGQGGDTEASHTNPFPGPGTTYYSTSNYSESAVSMTMTFTFQVSEVAKEGTDWAVKAVVDDGIATANAGDTSGYTTAWYGRVATQRASKAWTSVAAGGSATTNDYSSGTLITNGGADVMMDIASTFTDGQTTISNGGGTADTAVSANRQYAMDIDKDATYNDGAGAAAQRLTGSLADVETGVLTSGTTEAGDASVGQSFKLWLGNRIPRQDLNTYSGTLTVGITAD